MSREVRRVPANWEHPKREDGSYRPLLNFSFDEGIILWEEDGCDGDKPIAEDYMPNWKDEEKTHFQMYETCSEGTPISPVMDTEDNLARWLADNKASAFGSMTATYEQWLATIKIGSSPSMIFTPQKGLRSGVAASEDVIP